MMGLVKRLSGRASVLEYFNGRDGLNLSFEEFDYSAERYLRTGDLIPDEDLKLETFDAIYLGAVGDPVKAGILERGILIETTLRSL